MSENAAYIRAIAAKARLLSNEISDREVGEMLEAFANVYDTEPKRFKFSRNSKRCAYIRARTH